VFPARIWDNSQDLLAGRDGEQRRERGPGWKSVVPDAQEGEQNVCALSHSLQPAQRCCGARCPGSRAADDVC
jgi:hypothetical protein